MAALYDLSPGIEMTHTCQLSPYCKGRKVLLFPLCGTPGCPSRSPSWLPASQGLGLHPPSAHVYPQNRPVGFPEDHTKLSVQSGQSCWPKTQEQVIQSIVARILERPLLRSPVTTQPWPPLQPAPFFLDHPELPDWTLEVAKGPQHPQLCRLCPPFGLSLLPVLETSRAASSSRASPKVVHASL